ncbi:hypothetical protein EDC94DRAFT_665729 [Helicostylum pulchrum]|nr:hypothetical protein EDC94DRAFT_665729 [Helicostylum pulchrum]
MWLYKAKLFPKEILPVLVVFVCAICNDLHSSVDVIRTHFNTHLNAPSSNSTSSVSSSSDSIPSTSTSSTADATLLSPTSSTNPSSATSYKHPSDNSLESTKVKIIKGSKNIIFDTALSTGMQSIDDMSEEDTTVIRTHQDNQQCISSIADYHSNTLDILNHTLSSSKSHVDLFEYSYPNLDPTTATQDNRSFYQYTFLFLLIFIMDFIYENGNGNIRDENGDEVMEVDEEMYPIEEVTSFNVIEREERSGKAVGRPPILVEEHEKSLHELIDEKPSLVVSGVMDDITTKFSGLTISKSVLYKHTTEKCRIILKRAHFHSVERSSVDKNEERHDWVQRWLRTDIDYTSNCIFIDESAFHINMKRSFAWSRKGERAVAVVLKTRAKTTTTPGAVSPKVISYVSDYLNPGISVSFFL